MTSRARNAADFQSNVKARMPGTSPTGSNLALVSTGQDNAQLKWSAEIETGGSGGTSGQLQFIDVFTPSVAVQYPQAVNPTHGSYWLVNGYTGGVATPSSDTMLWEDNTEFWFENDNYLVREEGTISTGPDSSTGGFAFTTGSLAGKTAVNGDIMIWTVPGGWVLGQIGQTNVPGETVSGALLRDGTLPMTGDLDMNGNDLVDIGDVTAVTGSRLIGFSIDEGTF